MKLLTLFLKENKKIQRKTIEEHQRETLIETGKQQFKKLQTLGLRIPVALI